MWCIVFLRHYNMFANALHYQERSSLTVTAQERMTVRERERERERVRDVSESNHQTDKMA